MDDPFVIRDIAPPIETLPDTAIWPWLIIPLLLVAGVLLYRFFRKAEPEPAETPLPQLTVTPMQTALQALDALMIEKLIESGETKLFFTKLNMILRVFLSDRLDLKAPVQTTSEILRAGVYQHWEQPVAAVREAADPPISSAKERPAAGGTELARYRVPPSLEGRDSGTGASTSVVNLDDCSFSDLLAPFLRECDLFKFANVMAQADIARRAHGTCRALVIAIGEKKEEE
ncbi:MAG: hypothetical protein QGI24_03960 [Kiritimatiellia bacterium]|jgi:hypothetical protein|nr:hypothetical protein [Kiritimatiellia bacterium]MDP6847920.1 hypothetical protein [Kiritimatiellia bacterium]